MNVLIHQTNQIASANLCISQYVLQTAIFRQSTCRTASHSHEPTTVHHSISQRFHQSTSSTYLIDSTSQPLNNSIFRHPITWPFHHSTIPLVHHSTSPPFYQSTILPVYHSTSQRSCQSMIQSMNLPISQSLSVNDSIGQPFYQSAIIFASHPISQRFH